MDVRINSLFTNSPLQNEELDEYGNLAGFVVQDEEEDSSYSEEVGSRKRARSDGSESDTPKKKGKTEAEEPQPIDLKEYEEFCREEFQPPVVFRELCRDPENSIGSLVVGREKEAKEIIAKFGPEWGGARPLLIGPSGIGKTMIVEKVAYLYKTTSRGRLPKRNFFCLDSYQLFADNNKPNNPDAVVEALSRIMQSKYFFQGTRVRGGPVLYIKDIDKLFSVKVIKDYFSASFLKSPFPFIASISKLNDKSRKVVNFLEKFNFETMEVKESPLEDVTQIVLDYLSETPINSDVEVSFTKEAIRLGVALADKYVKTQPAPRKAINLIQECAVRILMSAGNIEKGVVIEAEHIAQHVSATIPPFIPASQLLDEICFDKERFMDRLKRDLIGQDHVIDCVSNCIAQYKLGLSNPKKPIGVFLFIGPTGVGKTSLAELLAQQLYNDKNAILRIDGGNYSESHSISDLIGSPKGYIGSEEGGHLTEPLKKNPHQVVLFDEIEKADPAVWNIFLRVFREGVLTGKNLSSPIDCSDTLFILTSNVGQKEIFLNPDSSGLEPQEIKKQLLGLLNETFKPEFCNRLDIVPFQPLKPEHYREVIEVKLRQYKESKKDKFELEWTDKLVDLFLKSDFDPRFGMSKLCETVEEMVKTKLVQVATKLKRPLKGSILLDADNGKIRVYMKK